MKLLELKERIIHKALSNFYIFTGNEIGIMNIYLNQINKVSGLPIVRADSFLSIYSKCTNRSMFGVSNNIYVIRGDADFAKQEKVWPGIKTDIKNNIIVLLYDKLDSRLKFTKFFKDDIVEFEQLTPSVLKTYIKKSIELNDTNVSKLIEVCNGSYDVCMLEIEKIKSYQNCTETADANICFQRLIADGTIYQPESTDVFQFVDLVCKRKSLEAFKSLDVLHNNNTSDINILGTLYSALKTIMLIQSCEDRKGICETTGLDNRLVYFNSNRTGYYSVEELVYAVKLIAKTINDIKYGIIDEIYSTKYVLCEII